MTSPVQRLNYATTDADEGTEQIRSLYTDHAPSFSGSARQYRLELSSAAVESGYGRLSVDLLSNTMRLTAPCDPVSALIIVSVTSGYASYRVGREQTGPIFLAPYWSEFQCEWDDMSCALGVLDLDGARRVAAEVTGLDERSVTFTGMEPVTAERARHVSTVVHHIAGNVLSNDEVMASPLARGEAFRELAAAAVLTFPNTALEQLTDPSAPPPGYAEPATVRRAVEFIDAHAQEDIDITRIAEASGIGPRGLQQAFRRYRDETPWSTCDGCGWRAPTATWRPPTRPAVTPSEPSPPGGASPIPDGSRSTTGGPTAAHPARRCGGEAR
ncbi:hypothetical protein LQ327_23270 [Actinomycetospora endophytica]|uniref:HTH araC/xylS-type domain-containing protein n=1 Tax=Actinomycetospora endophytica TaxID=2291215 RepID=A0ABS8PDF2_9PSEU|nr:hypothetical protein [Actinomycetospora endophytica]MCD2196300.1 hypothetical protein [Actinomycetospora endophytica]